MIIGLVAVVYLIMIAIVIWQPTSALQPLETLDHEEDNSGKKIVIIFY